MAAIRGGPDVAAAVGSRAVNAALRAVAALSLALCLGCAWGSGSDPAVRIEVDFLLGFVEGSGCDFLRNGSWHGPGAARSHLRQKYDFLEARGLVHSTEDFIDKAASYSSFSGEPYRVRCKGGTPVATGPWLRDELARFRAFKRKPASKRGETRPGSAREGRLRNASDLVCAKENSG